MGTCKHSPQPYGYQELHVRSTHSGWNMKLNKNHNDRKRPLITVVMPVLNGEKYLADAIDSVIHQEYRHFEFIIVNDGSTDKTDEIIKKYQKIDKRIVYIKNNKKTGQSLARNVAIKVAQGEYIALADSDDICRSNRFNKQIAYMVSHPKVDVLGTYFSIFFNDDPKKLQVVPAYSKNIVNGKAPVHNPTCVFKRSVFEKYGYYDKRFDNAEDVELWFRWFSKGVVFENIHEDLYKKRVHEGSVSISKIRHQVFLLFRINLNAIFNYGIKFSLHGYLYVMEQLLYLIYLSLHLDRLFVRDKSVYNIKRKAESEKTIN
ncbi:MAG: hypothetical protein C0412_02910 [Flavobacterium sp.]|nr:hypothetical protein [Flavobacterium sp.]